MTDSWIDASVGGFRWDSCHTGGILLTFFAPFPALKILPHTHSDSFPDSFPDSFTDSLTDSLTDSFTDSLTDSAAIHFILGVLKRLKGRGRGEGSKKDSFRILSGFFQDSFRIFFRIDWERGGAERRILLGFFRNSFRILLGFFQDSFRIFFRID